MENGIESFEEIQEIIKNKGIPSLFQEINPYSFQLITFTNSLLPLLFDYFDDFPEEANLAFFKSIIHEIFSFSIQKILEKLQKSKNTLQPTENPENIEILPQILAKWWIAYLSNLSEAYQRKKEKWGSSLTLWFIDEEAQFLIESLSCLEEHFHWKIVLLQGLCLNKDLFSERETFKYEENCEIIRKYQLARLEKEFHSLEMTKSQNEMKIREDPNCEFREKFLKSLIKILENPSILLNTSLLSGRIDKRAFPDLSHTVIIGDDGGFYVLLNKLSEKECEILLLTNEITEEYLKACKSGVSVEKTKFIIGKGSFGLLRFCMALSRTETSTTLKSGQIICVKKTANIGKSLGDHEVEMMDIRENVWNDYSAGDISRLIFSPAVYDMKIIEFNEENLGFSEKSPENQKEQENLESPDQQATKIMKKAVNSKKKVKENDKKPPEIKETKVLSNHHIKGYTMLQFVSVYDGSKVFLKNSIFCNNWSHQKAYLLHLFSIVLKLLNKGYCMTDLKPANTLYDSLNYRGMLIDLAGMIRRKSKVQLEACDVKYIHQYYISDIYAPNEVKNCVEDDIIDLTKVPAFSLGIIIKEIVLNFSYGKSFHHNLDLLYQDLRRTDPKKRISVEIGLERLQEIGKEEEEKTEKPDFSGFIKKLYEKTISNMELFGLNPGLLALTPHYIDLKVSSLDPEIFPHFESKTELFAEISEFFSSEERVFILLGASGSGKSTFLQKAYLSNLEHWKMDDPIPIYMNLAVEEDLKVRWKWLIQEIDKNQEEMLNFTVFSGIFKYPVRLYIDSFDEVGSKINFIEKFFEDLGNNNMNKCLITCRNELIQKETDFLRFFKPKEEDSGFIKRFILPLNRWDFNYEKYIEKYYENTVFEAKIEEIKRNIKEKNLKTFMLTSNMLRMTLDVFPQIMAEKEEITRARIFEKYIEFIIAKVSPIFKDLLMKRFDLKNDLDFRTFIIEAGLSLAETLFKVNSTKLNLEKGALFFEKYKFDKNIPCLENQILMGVVRSMDLHIEVKGNIPVENVSLGFLHDSIKTYFVAKLIVAETSKSGFNLLGLRNLIKEESLIKFLVAFVKEERDFLKGLKSVIFKGKKSNNEMEKNEEVKTEMFIKSPKSNNAVIRASANAITILIAANISFLGEDLSNIRIEGANLRDGCFINCDFTDAVLTDCNLRNCKLDDVLFQRTVLEKVNFGILPDIKIGTAINSIEFSNNDQEILCGCKDKTVKIFDTFTGRLLKELGKNHDSVNFATFSPDYFLILTGSEDGHAKIFDKSKGDLLKALSIGNSLLSGCFSPDSKRILVGSKDRKVRIWGKSGWQHLKTLICHNDWVTSVSYSNNGFTFLTSSKDKTMKIWEGSGRKLYKTFKGHIDWVNSACFSPDGNFLLSGSQDQTVRLWDRNTGTLIKIMEGHKESVISVSFSHNGFLLISGSRDCLVKLWDRNTGNLLQNFEGNQGEIACVRFSSDDNLIVSGSKDDFIKIFNRGLENKLKNYEGHTKSVNSVVFSLNGRYFVSSSEDFTVRVWDVKSGKLLKIFEKHEKPVTYASISPDDQKIVSCSEDKQIIIWDFNLNAPILIISAHNDFINFVCFSPDGNYILSCSRDKTMKLWVVETGLLKTTFEGHSKWVNFASISNENPPFIASASDDMTIKLWEGFSGKIDKTMKGHTNGVNSVVFLMENQCLLSGSDDYSIKLWMRNTGEIIQSFKEHTSWVRCVHVSANSSFAISTSADQTIKVWDLKERKILKTLTGHSKAVNSACFSRCGTMILSGSSDNSIKIWEAKSGNVLNDLKNKRKCEISHNSSMFLTVSKDFEIDLWDAMNLKFMKKFKGHTNNVKILAFSTYDEEIISGSDDKTIKLWSVKDGLLKTFENNFVEITSLCFSKKGDLIIVGDINGSVTLIETESGMCGIKLKIEGKSINYLAFSDDDTKILVKTNNNDLRFYEVMSWNLIENDPGVLNNFLKDEISNFQCKMTISCDETALSCENTILLEVEGLSPNDEKVIVQRGGKVLEKEKGNDFNSLLKQKEAQMPIRDERPIHNGCKCCKLI